MDGATAPRRRGTARQLLDGEGWRNSSSTAKDGAQRLLDGKGRRKRGGDGLRAQQMEYNLGESSHFLSQNIRLIFSKPDIEIPGGSRKKNWTDRGD